MYILCPILENNDGSTIFWWSLSLGNFEMRISDYWLKNNNFFNKWA
jgi:hypothetical protein